MIHYSKREESHLFQGLRFAPSAAASGIYHDPEHFMTLVSRIPGIYARPLE